MKHVKIKITGKVQGVFYRKNTLRQALSLNIKGFVQNQADGSVYAEAEGNEKALDQFVEWCKNGPVKAEVKSVDIKTGTVQNFEDFTVRK